MTATALNLKIRPNKTVISIPIGVAKQLLSNPDSEAKDALFHQMKSLVDANGPIHDRVWLETICNWTPPDGLPLVSQAPWIKLAIRISDLDDTKEGEFHLNDQEIDRIWKRLNDVAFKVRRDPAFDAFLMDFIDATGRDFTTSE